MKKWIGTGVFYCMCCGARLRQGSDLCPRCGFDTTMIPRAPSQTNGERVTERDVLKSKAFRAYQRKNTFVKLLWAVALAMGVPWALLSAGQIDLDDAEGRMVAIVLCCMFLLIGIGSCFMARRGREWRQKAVSGGKKVCVACGFPPRKNDCFCAKCGCAIINSGRDQAQSEKI